VVSKLKQEQADYSYFRYDIHEDLDLELIDGIVQGPQKAKNCGWCNIISGALAALYARRLCLGQDHSQAIKEPLKIYKQLIAFAETYKTKEYLDQSAARARYQEFRDPIFLKEILDNAKKKAVKAKRYQIDPKIYKEVINKIILMN
jgi:hypothetical protein